MTQHTGHSCHPRKVTYLVQGGAVTWVSNFRRVPPYRELTLRKHVTKSLLQVTASSTSVYPSSTVSLSIIQTPAYLDGLLGPLFLHLVLRRALLQARQPLDDRRAERQHRAHLSRWEGPRGGLGSGQRLG